MKTNIKLLEPNCIYHIYNRGINGETLFREEENYLYFLSKYALYIEKVAETYCYCLLNNHFHFMIRTLSEDEILKNYLIKNDGNLQVQYDTILSKNTKSVQWIISNAFASLFKSYSQKVNNSKKRTGRLLEEPFRRILVANDSYYTQLIYYIHSNPEKHGLTSDFKQYKFSSYRAYILGYESKLKREEVIGWFGDKMAFEKFHNQQQVLKNLSAYDLDDYLL